MVLFPNYEQAIFAGEFLALAKKSGYILDVNSILFSDGEHLHIKAENNTKLLNELCAKFGCSGSSLYDGFMIGNFNGYTNPIGYDFGSSNFRYRTASFGNAFVLINRKTTDVLDSSGTYKSYKDFDDSSHFKNTQDLMMMASDLADRKIDLSDCCFAVVSSYGIHTNIDF